MNHIATPAPAAGIATAEVWARFLRPLLASVSNPPSAEDFRKRVSAIAFALPDFPASLLTETAQRDLIRKRHWWPSAADIADHFADDLRHAREMLAIRQDRPALPPPDPAQRTPEEIEVVRAKARAFAAEMTGSARDPEREPPKPMPISDGAMLAHYERLAAQGNEAAATRAKAIKAKMEAGQ